MFSLASIRTFRGFVDENMEKRGKLAGRWPPVLLVEKRVFVVGQRQNGKWELRGGKGGATFSPLFLCESSTRINGQMFGNENVEKYFDERDMENSERKIGVKSGEKLAIFYAINQFSSK